MAVVSKIRLLLEYNTYKEHNGFIVPTPNDEDIRNGLDTPEKKYEAWSMYAQIQLNAVLQDSLSSIDYDLGAIKPVNQYDIINIMTTRLNRAFYNDEILPRDFGINVSQQGGVNYSSQGELNPKSALMSFFDANERLLIETSGIIETVFNAEDEEKTNSLEDNKFKSGELVPDVDLNEFQKKLIVINGQNKSVQQAITELQDGKVNKNELIKAIEDATGLSTTINDNKILVAPGKYILFSEYRPNKAANEAAQQKDVQDSEARSRADMVANQKSIKANNENIRVLDNRITNLEDEEEINDKVWNGDDAGTKTSDTTKEIIISTKVDQDGKNFDFTSGKHLLIGLLYDGSRYSGEIEVDAVPNDHIEINDANHSSSFDVVIDAPANPGEQTKLKITRTRGTVDIDSVSLGKILERKANFVPDITRKEAESLFIKKVLEQNVDFSTYAELKLLVGDGEFIVLTMASGETISGVITDNGTPIVITGSITDGITTKHENISIDANLNVTGGKQFSTVDLSNANVGTANAGKIFQVKADGTIEYVDKPTTPIWKDITQDLINKTRVLNKHDLFKDFDITLKIPEFLHNYNHMIVKLVKFVADAEFSIIVGRESIHVSDNSVSQYLVAQRLHSQIIIKDGKLFLKIDGWWASSLATINTTAAVLELEIFRVKINE